MANIQITRIWTGASYAFASIGVLLRQFELGLLKTFMQFKATFTANGTGFSPTYDYAVINTGKPSTKSPANPQLFRQHPSLQLGTT